MTDAATLDAYGVLTEPTTLRIERLLPGPVERIWSYLTDSDLRRKWLASGVMEPKAGSSFEFVWRNDELGIAAGKRPEGMPEENRMKCLILAFEAPRKLVFTFGEKAEVTWDLTPRGRDVLFTITHRRITDRNVLLSVSAGWHAHVDVLVAITEGKSAQPFWDSWSGLRKEYDQRLTA
ncbi:MAG: SRPBCC family protein [Proteobacteria bacterium]|nr:SRPBCC family protein [Pseudomonadota bacterium]